VTRTDGERQSVVVRINDRCAGRRKIIEVSHAAARQLGMLRAGLVPVELEIVPPPPPVRTKAADKAPEVSPPGSAPP
jgi:rare lipoprotein A